MKLFSLALLLFFVFISFASAERQKWNTKNRSKAVNSCLDFRNIHSKNRIRGGCEFRLISSISSPMANDGFTKLQANSFAIDHHSLAYVAYNVAGAQRTGALEIIDIKNTREPKIVSVLFFDDSEFSSVTLKKFKMNSGEVRKILLLAGAEGSKNRWGAIVQMVDVTNPSAPQRLSAIEIPGYYATQVQWGKGTSFWVSSGDNAGLISMKFNGFKNGVDSQSMNWTVEKQFELANSIAFIFERGTPLVLGGDKNTSIYSAEGKSLVNRVDLARVPLEAPAGIARLDHYIYVNGGATGLQVSRMKSKTEISKVSSLELPGDGNGIKLFGHGHRNLAFLAQGDAGLIIVNIRNPNKPIAIGSMDFGNNGSANAVGTLKHFDDSLVVLVGDGLGGIRIIERQARKSDRD